MMSRLISSAQRAEQAPKVGLPEFAVLGRSNVGKSTLLNALANARIARTSRTPGRTQLINFFELWTGRVRFVLADLPGYGFAKAPKAVTGEWGTLIEGYLETRKELLASLVLIDARRGAEDEDEELMAWLEARTAQRILVVATKTDKLAKAQIKPSLLRIAKRLGLDTECVHGVSGSSGEGVSDLRELLERLASRRSSQ